MRAAFPLPLHIPQGGVVADSENVWTQEIEDGELAALLNRAATSGHPEWDYHVRYAVAKGDMSEGEAVTYLEDCFSGKKAEADAKAQEELDAKAEAKAEADAKAKAKADADAAKAEEAAAKAEADDEKSARKATAKG